MFLVQFQWRTAPARLGPWKQALREGLHARDRSDGYRHGGCATCMPWRLPPGNLQAGRFGQKRMLHSYRKKQLRDGRVALKEGGKFV